MSPHLVPGRERTQPRRAQFLQLKYNAHYLQKFDCNVDEIEIGQKILIKVSIGKIRQRQKIARGQIFR